MKSIPFTLVFLLICISALSQRTALLNNSWKGSGQNLLHFNTTDSTALFSDNSTALKYEITDSTIYLRNSQKDDSCDYYFFYRIMNDSLMLKSLHFDKWIILLRLPTDYSPPPLTFDSIDINATYCPKYLFLRVRNTKKFLFKYGITNEFNLLGYHSGVLNNNQWGNLISKVEDSTIEDLSKLTICPKNEEPNPDGCNEKYKLTIYQNGKKVTYTGNKGVRNEIIRLASYYYENTINFNSFQSDENGVPDSLKRIYLPFAKSVESTKLKKGIVYGKIYDPVSKVFYYTFMVDSTLNLMFSTKEIPTNREIGILRGYEVNNNLHFMAMKYGINYYQAKSFIELSKVRIFYRGSAPQIEVNDQIRLLPPRSKSQRRAIRKWGKTAIAKSLITLYEKQVK